MASFNKVILMGNLTRDPEMRVTPSGHTICKLGLAVSRAYSTRDGERREETTFVDIDAFGKQAEVISKYMRKGRPIMVEGRLKLDQWESNDGQKRSKLGVVLENFQFLGGRDDNSSGGGGYEDSSPPQRSGSSSSRSSNEPEDTLDEDVPF
ncbi:single-stranded DNA-binding protein [Coraliomargarita parva]|uniref:single-stranded DNA-binding protein n=1 Tax=Coraliomargarita parva TaxID=3014050 RepID=UPI0022B3279F|nr:single-stranded DNA-binding protein [Coraliomargarita parva]